jgi:SsrA-binding protein
MSKKQIAANPKARHDYIIEDKYEAGVVLTGSEVKSLRGGGASIKEAFGRIDKGEIFLYNMHVKPYEQGQMKAQDATRPRKLLLHKREIDKLIVKTQEKGYALVPLATYFLNGKVKIEIGLGRGKKLYDKRHSLKEKQVKREIDRAIKSRKR